MRLQYRPDLRGLKLYFKEYDMSGEEILETILIVIGES